MTTDDQSGTPSARERWERVQAVFHRVADLPVDARARELDVACAGDDALRAEVDALLRADAAGASVLDGDVGAIASAILPTADASRVPAQRFGPYRLVRPLGEGGMGVVYLATRDDLHSDAAIKVLRDAWLSPARRARFVAEQQLLAQLNHPSIARLYDAGTLADGTPWIAMEYVDGVSLSDYCQREQLSLAARLRLMRAVGEAVMHAHAHLVIHRDLKPSNVMVRADGSVKLLDFGIAKQLDEGADADTDITRTGFRMMTPAYAAPEQLRGDAVSVRTDVYALGVMLYELLTGTRPFDITGASVGEAERRILENEPATPSSRARADGAVASRAEWEELDLLCLTAMQKDPERRYRSVDALLRDIEHVLAREPLEAHADGLGYRFSMFVRRHQRAVVASAAAAVLLVSAATFYTVRLAQARDHALSESLRAQRIQRFMTSLFQGGDEGAGPADSLRVVTLLANGVADARALDREPEVQADLYLTLGNIYRQLGQFERADTLLNASVAQWTRLDAANHGAGATGVARGLVALGDLRTDQAKYDDAERYLRRALASLSGDAARASAEGTAAMIALGRSLTERGEYAKSIAVLDSVVVALRAGNADSLTLLDGAGELANAHFYAGHYDAADSINRQVLAMTQRLFGDRHPRVAEDLMNLGATQQERGQYTDAEKYFREALERTRAYYGENHFRTAGNLVYLGRSLLQQQRYDDARAAFEQSLAIRERVFGPTHPTVANTLNEIGGLAVKQEHYDDAEAAFRRVREIYIATYPGFNYKVGVATGNLADVYLYRKDFAKAEPMYREALRHYIASQGPEHLNTGIGYIKLGRCLLRSGHFKDGQTETRRGFEIVRKIANPEVSFLQAARLDLSIGFDSLHVPDSAAYYRREREKYLPKPKGN